MVVHWLFLVIKNGHHQVFKAFHVRFCIIETSLWTGSWHPELRSCSCDFSGSVRMSGCHRREKEALRSGGVPSFVINSLPDLKPFIMLRKGFSCSFRTLTSIKLSIHHSSIKALLELWFLGFAPDVSATMVLKTKAHLHLLSWIPVTWCAFVDFSMFFTHWRCGSLCGLFIFKEICVGGTWVRRWLVKDKLYLLHLS